MRGNWVFKPEVTSIFSQPFIEIGWLKGVPAPSANPARIGHPGFRAGRPSSNSATGAGAPPVPVK